LQTQYCALSGYDINQTTCECTDDCLPSVIYNCRLIEGDMNLATCQCNTASPCHPSNVHREYFNDQCVNFQTFTCLCGGGCDEGYRCFSGFSVIGSYGIICAHVVTNITYGASGCYEDNSCMDNCLPMCYAHLF
jgi:hypothetical protein